MKLSTIIMTIRESEEFEKDLDYWGIQNFKKDNYPVEGVKAFAVKYSFDIDKLTNDKITGLLQSVRFSGMNYVLNLSKK